MFFRDIVQRRETTCRFLVPILNQDFCFVFEKWFLERCFWNGYHSLVQICQEMRIATHVSTQNQIWKHTLFRPARIDFAKIRRKLKRYDRCSFLRHGNRIQYCKSWNYYEVYFLSLITPHTPNTNISDHKIAILCRNTVPNANTPHFKLSFDRKFKIYTILDPHKFPLL